MVKEDVKKPNVIGVVHARGGSRRIPLKNLALLNGRPLVSYIIKAALGSGSLRRVIVSTDHPEIKKVALEYGAEVPFVRPASLAEDCPSEYVTQHALKFVEEAEGSRVDIAVTLQPTTPFCRPEDIAACVDKLIKTGADSVCTGCEVHERPEWMFRMDGDKSSLYVSGEISGERGVYQSLQKLYMPNGAAYATTRKCLMEDGLIIGRRHHLVIMPRELSVDIDELVDLKFAEFLAREIGIS